MGTFEIRKSENRKKTKEETRNRMLRGQINAAFKMRK
jgi:hypothetical protein